MERSLNGRVALITGGSRGIGRATALRLARGGADVAINYVSHEEEAEEVVNEAKRIGVGAIAIRADVAIPIEVEEMVNNVEVAQSFLKLVSLLINKRALFLISDAIARSVTKLSVDSNLCIERTSETTFLNVGIINIV